MCPIKPVSAQQRGCSATGILLSLWLSGIAGFALTGCQSRSGDTALRFGLASAPVTLDPRYSTDAISSRINRLFYRQLIDFDTASQPVPALATWQKLTPTHFRFVLREQSRLFHDGTRLTAHDVKATFDSVLDGNSASPHRATLHMVKEILVIDDDTVDFVLNIPDPLFPGYLEVGILPAAKIKAGHPFSTQPVGSGAFRFLHWPESDRLRLQRVSDQQEFEFVHVREENTRVLKLLRGEIDMLQNDIDAELVKYLSDQDQVLVAKGAGSNFSYLGFNLKDPVVGQLAVRQAIAYAIDRQAIIIHLFSGRARLANAMLTPDHWAGHPDLPGYEYAPEKARRLLAPMGFSSANPLRITYKTSNNPFRIRLATIIQSQLAAVGIEVSIQTYDWGTFYGDIKSGNFQMFSLAWVGINLPDIFRQVFHSQSTPPDGANRGRYDNPRVDQLLEAARNEQDAGAQAALYREIQVILHQELPYVPLWYEDHVYAARKNVQGYRLHLDGNYDGLADVHRANSGIQPAGVKP
ncbi:MAG TPA: ABC transporter substrate-binding protein [Gammaproteobacteria bacterium]